MVLVDTTIWSLALRRDDTRLSDLERKKKVSLHELISHHNAQMIGPIRQEILSGIRHADQFSRIRRQLSAFADEPLQMADFELAAEFSNLALDKGIAGSNVDFLICSVAASRSWKIFTDDGDFVRYSQFLPVALF
jgi:predicted nucleic acid-binding protein